MRDEDLHAACLHAIRKIRWRLEKQARDERRRFVPFDELVDVAGPDTTEDFLDWGWLLDSLTADERHIVLDLVLHGWSEMEVAERMGWSASRVHRTKHRALDKLQ